MSVRPTPAALDTTVPGTIADEQRDERRRRRAAVVRFTLAGAALLGIGAAATSATWTDDAWFSAGASAVDPDSAIVLEGAFNETAPGTQPADDLFQDADEQGSAVVIPASVFADLTAGDTVSTTIWLRNNGTSDLQVAPPVAVADGALFAEDGATVTVTDAPGALAVDEVRPATVTITLPADADAATFGGATGTVAIQLQGQIAPRS